MTDDSGSKPTVPGAKDAPKPKKTRAKKSAKLSVTAEPAAKSRSATAKTRKPSAKSSAAKSAAKAAPKKKAPANRKSATKVETTEAAPLTTPPFEDPIGDLTDGEGHTYTGDERDTELENQAEAYRAGVAVDAVDGTPEASEPGQLQTVELEEDRAPAEIGEQVAKGRESEAAGKPRPQAKLERLQKILSQAGIASRRHAEEMIVAGRVVVNGQVVTALGSKADPEHDHIRVDGKLLHGAERHRYFVLNKPKGYLTTVSDPEGRPTVMDLVQKLGERVYPVGRLDFQSEGLLLMTNDGALANKLTHASSGVEKTYVVKIAGQPDEEALERLRTGVMIERGGPTDSGLYGPGGRVRTAPATVRQIRAGENPWFEVVLTEGRNRELRKMFAAIGHYVEKIRRVGYGPLMLDVEPGKLRELTADEVEALRLTAEGKLKPRRVRTEAMLPKDAGRSSEARTQKRTGGQSGEGRPAKPFPRGESQRGADTAGRRRGDEGSGPGEDRSGSQERPRREFQARPREWQPRPRGDRPAWSGPRQPRQEFPPRREERRGGEAGPRPGERPARKWGNAERQSRGDARTAPAGRGIGDRPFRKQGPTTDRRGSRPFRDEGGPASGNRGRSERPFRSQGGPGTPKRGRGEQPFRGEARPAAGNRGRGERPFRSESRPPAGDRGRDERPFRGEGRPPGARDTGGFGAGSKFASRGRFGGQRSGRGPGKPGGFRSGPPRGGKPGGGRGRG
jgi:23S rRNA pseudouridine2605 synthase